LLGHKTKAGFYVYDKHQKKPNPNIEKFLPDSKEISADEQSDISDRMLLRMVNEAAYCYSESVITSTDDGDVGAVFGVGFPAYLGGPFRFIETEGTTTMAQKLDSFVQRFGHRFLKAPFFEG
jgi:3-hydroxyacyl-CoA dehydrogenase / enoyl-CoA hydratase / 3-hydroxybutyryl-CoA epimerase